jgi:general secretion pathway protein G
MGANIPTGSRAATPAKVGSGAGSGRAWPREGFTLLELMMVMVLMLILVSFALPAYQTAIQRAREAVLRDDLMTMRQLIDEYTVDKQAPPQSLQDLVDAGYLRGGVPVDPMTGSADTWKVDVDQVPVGGDQVQSGIVDVHSGSGATALDGTAYSTW